MYLFQDLRKAAKGVDFKSQQDAANWYRNAAMNINKKAVSQEKIMASAEPFKMFKEIQGPAVGKMFMFVYDAKHKRTLPFYDKFPLVFPLTFYVDGFLGLNLHYLPPMARAGLMNALYDIANNNKYNATMKLNISYDILKQAAGRFAGFEMCVKRYLFSHVKSGFHYVNPADWDKALMLPMQKWHVNPLKQYRTKAPPY